MNALQRLMVGFISASLWPLYWAFLAVIIRIGPWPKNVGRVGGFVLTVLAVAAFLSSMLKWMFRGGGRLQQTLQMTPESLRQLRRAKIGLILAAVTLLLPEEILSRGLITTEGRPIAIPTICHLLIIVFELYVWVCAARLLRAKGAVGRWLAGRPDALGRLGRHPRAVRILILLGMGCIIGLEVQGYGFTARRIGLAGVQSILLIGLCWFSHRTAVALIAQHAWRWIRREAKHGTHADSRSNGATADLPSRVRRLVDWGVPLLGGMIGLWVWDVDLALFNYVGRQTLWRFSEDTAITVANVVTAIVCFLVTAGIWRYIGTIFTLFVYPRMPDDPGIRFAVLTLCRYLVLGIGLITGLSSLQLGLDKIGVVVAALGVGLGFGLQEIVSNFISGIILLLERPIRVGDIVTVASMTGKIDRINIRATTLINADNQSLIIPNREFITGNLVNWTHKDKIIRFSIFVGVELGSDPDVVSEILLKIARADSDVLGNPVPTAFLESFEAAALRFALHVHVAEPSLTAKVKHRLCTQIQRRFTEAGIAIPLPTQELVLGSGVLETATRIDEHPRGMRVEDAGTTPHVTKSKLTMTSHSGIRFDPGTPHGG